MRIRNTRGRTWGQWSLIEASWRVCDLCDPMSLRGFVAAALSEMALPGHWPGARRPRRFRGEPDDARGWA